MNKTKLTGEPLRIAGWDPSLSVEESCSAAAAAFIVSLQCHLGREAIQVKEGAAIGSSYDKRRLDMTNTKTMRCLPLDLPQSL